MYKQLSSSSQDANIATINDMKKRFGCEAGLSDHTLGNATAIAASALGASVIEKHFTLSRDNGAIDSAFSMEPNELKSLMRDTKNAILSVGKVHYGATKAEEAARDKRRSIYIAKDIKKGDVFNEDNLRRVRPGLGLSPKYYDEIIGRKASQDIVIGTALKWELVS